MPSPDGSAVPAFSAVASTGAPDRAVEGTSGPALIERYADMVFNLAVRLTGDREEARDLAQDACLRILKGAGSFRGEASAKTWVCQVVINCHRNRSRWWRRLKRGRAVSLDEPLPSSEEGAGPTLESRLPDPAPGADRLLAADEARRRIQQEMLRLPADQRAALVLREIEGMSYTEIAAVLGIREGTVKSRLSRARETLRAALADLAGGGGAR